MTSKLITSKTRRHEEGRRPEQEIMVSPSSLHAFVLSPHSPLCETNFRARIPAEHHSPRVGRWWFVG